MASARGGCGPANLYPGRCGAANLFPGRCGAANLFPGRCGAAIRGRCHPSNTAARGVREIGRSRPTAPRRLGNKRQGIRDSGRVGPVAASQIGRGSPSTRSNAQARQ